VIEVETDFFIMFATPELPSRILRLSTLGILAVTVTGSGAQTLYSFGNPNANEQYHIELINRARANPPAEGARLAASTDPEVVAAYTQYGVNLSMMQSEFNALAAAPPLAPNAALTTAARGHSQWMLANEVQSHDETNPNNTFAQRITAAGYSWSSLSENVYAYAKSVWHGHAGFQVDWGAGTGGMQPGRGHRTNIHSASYREIGVGVTLGTNGSVGPQLVTQDFGFPSDSQVFGTGVAYYDLNGNNFYDLGEGISGLTVNVAGATKYCTTAEGGGWVVPIPQTAATRVTTFSGLGIDQSRDLVVTASKNAKVDLKLAYTPPAITSAATATAGAVHNFSFSAVGGATGYNWNCWTSAAAAPENCDSLTNVTVSTTSSYAVLNTTVKQEGSGSFHLANPGAIGKQIVELNSLFQGGQTTPSLAFQSRLQYATSDEHHSVQVKEEGSTVWQEVYNQDGGTPESSFSLKTVSLSSMAGKSFRVRFVLDFAGGSTYGSTADNVGWFIDAISFTNITTLTSSFSQVLAGTSGSFTPVEGSYLLSVAPVISGIEFPSADQTFTVTAPVGPEPGFATWAASFESANNLAAGTLADYPNGDPDGDGRGNLIEYAFGTSPVLAGESSPRLPAIQQSATDFVIRYVRDTELADIALGPVASSNLTEWKSPGQSGAPAGFTDTLVSTAGNLETREAKIPLSAGSNWFMKVRVTKP
jgi:hypothetical protein